MNQVLHQSKTNVAKTVNDNVFDGFFVDDSSLLKLLVVVRGSVLLPDEKMELRDLILEYSQIKDSESREIVRRQITKILKNKENVLFLQKGDKNIKDTVQSKQDTAGLSQKSLAVKANLGVARPTPTFIVKNNVKVQEELKIVETEPKKSELSAPQREVEIKREAPVETIVEEKPVSVSAPELSVPHVVNPMERISEIKRLVNSKVGNPVNLISSNNDIGREYMNSLLDAMKKSNGSSPDGFLDVAMARLEKAYSAVLNMLESGVVVTPEKVSEPVSRNEPLLKAEVTTDEVDLVQKPQVTKTLVTSSETQPELVAEKKLESVSANNSELKSKPRNDIRKNEPVIAKTALTPLPVLVNPEKVDLSKKHRGLLHEPEENVLDIGTGLSDARPVSLQLLKDALLHKKPEKKVANVLSEKTEDKKTETKAVVGKAETTPTRTESDSDIIKLSPVSKTTTLPEKMNGLQDELKKKEETKKTPVAGFDATEVTQGLSQLLSEWKLFKRSGFLGTGPNGVEHPLYKKIAKLPMIAVIAGRFEGATPEIKQSITDYMNGWRYEQGIVHEMGETFEHYLRRVIFHIIERQKSEIGA